MFDFVDYIIITILGIGMIVLVIGVFTITYYSYQEFKHCAEWETVTDWQKPYTSFIYTGKVMIPIHHEGEFVDKQVCIKPKGE